MAQNLVIGGVTYNGVESMEMTNADGKRIIYLEKVNLGTGVYVAEIGEQKFYTVEDALAAAASGETVMLIADAVENASLMVPSGVTLDLNGHTLEANFFVSSAGSQVLNSKVTGILKVPYGNIAIHKTNTYVPVYNGVDGYYFIEWGYGTKLATNAAEGTATYYFLPKPRNAGTVNNAVVDLLQNGAADNQIRIEGRLEWEDGGNKRSMTLVYSDSNISKLYTSNPSLNNNGVIFSLALNNFSEYTNPRACGVVVSDLGPEDASSFKALT